MQLAGINQMFGDGSMLYGIFSPIRSDPFLLSRVLGVFFPLKKIFYCPPPCNLFSMHTYIVYAKILFILI